jgi:hypothetical protein
VDQELGDISRNLAEAFSGVLAYTGIFYQILRMGKCSAKENSKKPDNSLNLA